MIDHDEQERRAKAERRRARLAERQLRDDVQAVFKTEPGRRLLWAFLQVARTDHSPMRTSPEDTAHAIGWADGGRWWLDLIARHCPEREPQMRNEAREAARVASQGNDDDDDASDE